LREFCGGVAAWQNGIPDVLIEAAGHVGGLAGGIRVGENVYECGPMYFTRREELLAEIKELMGRIYSRTGVRLRSSSWEVIFRSLFPWRGLLQAIALDCGPGDRESSLPYNTQCFV